MSHGHDCKSLESQEFTMFFFIEKPNEELLVLPGKLYLINKVLHKERIKEKIKGRTILQRFSLVHFMPVIYFVIFVYSIKYL